MSNNNSQQVQNYLQPEDNQSNNQVLSEVPKSTATLDVNASEKALLPALSNDTVINNNHQQNGEKKTKKNRKYRSQFCEDSQEMFNYQPSSIQNFWKQINLKNYFNTNAKEYQNNKLSVLFESLNGILQALNLLPYILALYVAADINPWIGVTSVVLMNFVHVIFGNTQNGFMGVSLGFILLTRTFMDQEGPLKKYSKSEKYEHLWLMVIFAGIWQFLSGLFQIQRFFATFPKFVNYSYKMALAVLLIIASIKNFAYCDDKTQKYFQNCNYDKQQSHYTLGEGETWIAISYMIFICICMWLTSLFPKVGKIMPFSLILLVLVSIFEYYGNREYIEKDTRILGETFDLQSKLIHWNFPKMGSDISNGGYKWNTILVYSAYLLVINLFEMSLTFESAQIYKDKLTTQQCYQFVEVSVQGINNILTVILGGAGTILNHKKIREEDLSHLQKTTKITNLFSSFSFLIIGYTLNKAVDHIPVGGLTGVLYYIIIFELIEWRLFYLVVKKQLMFREGLIIVGGCVLAVFVNISAALILFIAMVSIFGVWDQSQDFQVEVGYYRNTQDYTEKIKIYNITGNIYFSTVQNFFNSLFPSLDDKHVILNLEKSKIKDFSAVNAVNDMSRRYQNQEAYCEESKKLLPNPKQLWCQNIDEKSSNKYQRAKQYSTFITTVPALYKDQLHKLSNIRLGNQGSSSEEGEEVKEKNTQNNCIEEQQQKEQEGLQNGEEIKEQQEIQVVIENNDNLQIQSDLNSQNEELNKEEVIDISHEFGHHLENQDGQNPVVSEYDLSRKLKQPKQFQA